MTTEDVDRAGRSRISPLAQRLFRDFDGLPASAVFAAVGRARRTLSEHGELLDPQVVEELARALLRAQARQEPHPPWFA